MNARDDAGNEAARRRRETSGCGAVDQAAFEQVIRDNLSPEGVATIIAFLQPACFHKPADEAARHALRQVEWFADTLIEMLGVDEYDRLIDELGL